MKGQDSEGYRPFTTLFCFETNIYSNTYAGYRPFTTLFTLHSYLSNTYAALCTAGRISISQKSVGIFRNQSEFILLMIHRIHTFKDIKYGQYI